MAEESSRKVRQEVATNYGEIIGIRYGDIIINADNFEELPPAAGESPYKGLAHFTEADADRFFGRETLCNQMVMRLQRMSFLTVIGASGSGKSSLLQAGIVPRLRQRDWSINMMTPTSRPLQRLASVLTRDEAPVSELEAMRATLLTNTGTLLLAADKWASRAGVNRVLLIIDQFEELFTLCHNEVERQAFVDNIVATADEMGAATILIGLRADFYEHCARYEGLRALVSQQQEYLGPMSQEDLISVIAEPARRGGWQLVEGLVEQFLEDVGREPGRLPLLSHALLETWQRRRGIVLTLGGYREAGGVQGAIAKTAEDTFARLNEAERALMEQIFLALTELGEGAEDTRRIATRAELVRRAQQEDVDRVLEELVVARLITSDEGQVQVAHEALIRRWPRLSEWVDENRNRLRFERQLKRDAQQWQDLDRDPGALYRGARLGQVQVWQQEHTLLGLSRLEQAFIEASSEAAYAEELKARRRRNRTFAALAVVATVMTLLALWALQQSRVALSRQLAAQASAFAGSQGDLALLLGLQAYQIDPSFETENGLLTALQANSNVVAFLHGPTGRVQKVLFSPDGKTAAAASDDHNIYLWDVTTRRPLSPPLAGHEGAVRDLAYSEDGSLLLSAGADGQVILWDVGTKGPIERFENENGVPVNGAAIGADGQFVALGDEAGYLAIWNRRTKQFETRVAMSTEPINSVAFSPSEGLVAAAGEEGTLGLFSLDTLDWQEAPLASDQASGIWDVTFSPYGDYLATGGEDGTIALWTVDPLDIFGLPARGHDGAVYAVAFDASGHVLASGSEDRSIILWQVDLPSLSGTRPDDFVAALEQVLSPKEQLSGHGTAVHSLAIRSRAHGSSLILSGAGDSSVALWDAGPEIVLGRELEKVEAIPFWNLALSGDGHWLALSSCGFESVRQQIAKCENGTISLYDLSRYELLNGEIETVGGSKGIAFSPDSGELAYAGCATLDESSLRCVEGQIWRRDMGSGKTLGPPLTGHQGRILSLAYHPDGEQLASSSMDGTIIIWQIDNGEQIYRLDGAHEGPVWEIAYNQDGTRLASVGEDHKIVTWDTSSGEKIDELVDHNEPLLSVAFSPTDAALWAVSGWDNLVTLHGSAGGEGAPASLVGHTKAVYETAFGREGRWLASGSGDEKIILWDVERQQALGRPLDGHTGGVTGLAFDRQRKKLYSVGMDGRVIEWEVDVEAWHQLACRKANRSLSADEWGFHFDFGALYRILSGDVCPEN